MSNQTIESIQKTSDTLFIGLQSYSEAQSNIFFGRDEEIERLTNLVKANTLTIVFGKSGTGKTSLLNAGVFPPLRKDYFLPFRIRLQFNDESPDLVTQIKNILKSEIDKYGFKVGAYPDTETLWEYFHSEQLWKSITPILIFDQFEEIFTLAKKSNRFGSKELAAFWEELADLVENSIPEKLKNKFLNDKEQIDYSYKNQKIKMLFSFREEFLPEFENITSKIPSIKYSRFRLMPMNGNQAYEVITKTWKAKIDTEQANKIVGFFSNEEDKNNSLDVMEIEPSLLSQVCSYIDKERITEGRDKISAQFLNKYPKEIILRSIYDEALSESNDAVHKNGNELSSIPKPVNDFLEDKLITDEGYRTKYSLTGQDEKLKPGIDVLKKKYFLRDDGKSVELTHDVLTPIIKSDREERRKTIALAMAKQKARKRATQIIVGAFLFSLLIAGLIWFFTTKKARKDKAVAEQETVIIKQSIVKDSIKLDSVKKRIDLLDVNKNDPDKLLMLQKQNIKSDSVIKMLNGKMKELATELTANKSSSDSIKTGFNQNLENLAKSKYEDSLAAQSNYEQLNKKFADLNNTYASLNNDYTNVKSDDAKSKADYTTLKNNYDDLKRDYDLLNRNFNSYKESQTVVPAAKPSQPLDNNSLRLNLYSSKNQDIPGNLIIYLIPDISANKKLIRDLKNHDNHYDFASLKKAQGAETAIYDDNGYSFPDVAPGDYFIKICSNYGPYENVTKKAEGIETTPKIDYSEIIR
ncbi:MAG TPA: ATP-binding protein [Hanamia sp.]